MSGCWRRSGARTRRTDRRERMRPGDSGAVGRRSRCVKRGGERRDRHVCRARATPVPLITTMKVTWRMGQGGETAYACSPFRHLYSFYEGTRARERSPTYSMGVLWRRCAIWLGLADTQVHSLRLTIAGSRIPSQVAPRDAWTAGRAAARVLRVEHNSQFFTRDCSCMLHCCSQLLLSQVLHNGWVGGGGGSQSHVQCSHVLALELPPIDDVPARAHAQSHGVE